jgi:hypothetical protein
MSTNLTELDKATSASSPPSRQKGLKVMVFLASFAVSATLFLAFDFAYSDALQRAPAVGKLNSCRISDRTRHHALKPDCFSMDRWGNNSYEFFTNSLGFRDDKIRDVPLTDPRPRILILGNSFTEGELPWQGSYVGVITLHFPQYDFLNGGLGMYSPSNYVNVTRKLLATGYEIDEVVVFLDTANVADEAAFYHDVDDSGAVAGPQRQGWPKWWYARLRYLIAKHLFLTNDVFEFVERQLVAHGYYHLTVTLLAANVFDLEGPAWPYRKVNESDPYPSGYAPLGLEGGLAKEKAKMDLLWQELQERNIPLSIVVYPYPSQVVHDSVDSRQVRIWREWCQGKCERFISLFPAFFAVKDQCLGLQPGCWYLDNYVFGDFHLNAKGNTLIAQGVIESLADLPPGKIATKPK